MGGDEMAELPRAPREESEALRQRILDVVRGREGGAGAADLYASLGRDDEKGKQAVNAALMALKREGAIRQADRRQAYTVVEHPQGDKAA
jgi:Fe2+ or Zn2+ uptake regulation protein